MRRYVMEFVGTLFLVLAIGLTAGATPMAPLAIGLTLMVMIYAGGHISGAHYNPAVTLAIFLRGKLPQKDIAPYMAAQIGGALAAAILCSMIRGKTFAPAPDPEASFVAAVLVEFLLTFALAFVILNVATSSALDGNPFYGAAIGMTVTAGAFAGGPISGGAFNPAVYIGPALIHSAEGVNLFTHLPLYLLGPLPGGVAAAYVFRYLAAEGEEA